MTARQIIETRLGRELPPTADLPPDLRDALRLLGLHLVKSPKPEPPNRTKRGWVPTHRNDEPPF